MNANRTVSIGLTLSLGVALLSGVAMLRYYEQRIESEAASHLKTMVMLRDSVLTSYFESLRSEVLLWSSQPIVVDLLQELASSAERGDPGDLDEFGTTEATRFERASRNTPGRTVDDRVEAFARHHGYYDVFFISRAGDVLYTLVKESDYLSNLVHGPLSDTGLGRLFRELDGGDDDDRVAFVDFTPYPPSDDAPAAFLGARVYSGSAYIGVYAVQIPTSAVNEIMQFSAGMGESGETYLVGADGLMRSDSRFSNTSTVLETRVSGSTVDEALAGGIGVAIVDDYRGVPVYSAYRDFDFEGTRWAVLAEQDVAEVRRPVTETRLWFGGASVLLCAIGLLLRYAALHMVLPASVAVFLGASAIQHMDDD
jgi:methyl-accepting chemotaxis protein